MTTALPGFADPVYGAQACFRAVLSAMSAPGQVVAVGAAVAAPSPLDPATAAVLLTLADADTPLWLDPAAATALPWVTFHCGSPPAPPNAAMFGLSLGLPDLAAFFTGTHEAPERSTTLIVQLPELGRGRAWPLGGPGLDGGGTLQAVGLPEDLAAVWARNAALYPRGIDLVLCAGHAVAALPRTVRIG